MSKYPDWFTGQDVTATLLDLMVPTVVVKGGNTDRSATTTLADDPDLSGIALGVGTHWIRLVIMATCNTSATPDFKTQWAFTGTWSAPVRACKGPGATNTAARTDVTVTNWNGAATTTTVAYGFPASTGYNIIEEECFNATVTVAGNLSLQWAQNTSDPSTTSVKAGSAFVIRQVA
jgi:hypothetical protein